jgi:hypothetical protein
VIFNLSKRGGNLPISGHAAPVLLVSSFEMPDFSDIRTAGDLENFFIESSIALASLR